MVIGPFSRILVSHGSCGAFAHTPQNLDDPETVIRMIVKAYAEMDLETLETHMAADEDTVGYTIGGRKFLGWKDVKQAFEEEIRCPVDKH